MSLGAVAIAALATGLCALLLEEAFGERRRLTLAGAAFRFEKLKQALLVGFEFMDAPPQRKTSVTESSLHADKLANETLRSCATLPGIQRHRGRGAKQLRSSFVSFRLASR